MRTAKEVVGRRSQRRRTLLLSSSSSSSSTIANDGKFSAREGEEGRSRQRRRACHRILTLLLVSSCCCLITVAVAAILFTTFFCGVYGLYCDQGRHDLPDEAPTGQGVLLFAYGTDNSTTEGYLREAFVAARRIKALNPKVNITLVTNPDLHPNIDGAFDMLINIEPKYMLQGKVQSWTPEGVPRQWLTRIEYLGRSPYQVTFALDSGVLCCSPKLDEVLRKGLQGFDVAFAVQAPRGLSPHNWAIMYRLNDETRRLFHRWRILQIAYTKAGSDQRTLYAAAGSLAQQGKLNVGVLSGRTATALVSYSRASSEWPKTSQLIAPGDVLFVHYRAHSQEEETLLCNKLNEEVSRARVWFQGAHMRSGYANTLEMKYTEAELAEAASKGTRHGLFFQDLDWNNVRGKWGYAVTPWRDHCLECWARLHEDVGKEIQTLKKKPKVRWSPAFAKEFEDDRMSSI